MSKKNKLKKQRMLIKSAVFGPAYKLDEELYWSPVPKLSPSVPWGYDIWEEDKDILVPDNDALRKLEIAKKLVKKYSLRQVAAWLEEETGRACSHMTLYQRLRYEKDRGYKATLLRYYAEKAQDALAKAKKAEEYADRFRPKSGRSGSGTGEVIRLQEPDSRDYCSCCGYPRDLPTERGSSD